MRINEDIIFIVKRPKSCWNPEWEGLLLCERLFQNLLHKIFIYIKIFVVMVQVGLTWFNDTLFAFNFILQVDLIFHFSYIHNLKTQL